MFDNSERLSLIATAYTLAYTTYQIGVQSFTDYALSCIYKYLDKAKYDYYAQCRCISPVQLEEFFWKESPVKLEEYIILQDFLQRIPSRLRYVAVGYINKLTADDLGSLLQVSLDEIERINKEIGKLWLAYNSLDGRR